MPRTRSERPIAYRDFRDRVWYVSEIAKFKVVSAAIDGPNLCQVIRFEREGEERFARWIGGREWQQSLDRLFEEAAGDSDRDDRVRMAPPETVAVWVKLVATMGPDELADFDARTFREWDRASLGDLRRAIERRWKEFGG